MSDFAILDSGPLVALLDAREEHHEWSAEALRGVRGPLVTCEPVLTEAMFLLREHPAAHDRILEWVARGSLAIPFRLAEEAVAIRRLMAKYRDVPMSLADACVVRLTEMLEDHRVCTLDSDFRVYRRHGRERIPLIVPR